MTLSNWQFARTLLLGAILVVALPVQAQQPTPKLDRASVIKTPPASDKVPYDDECCEGPGENSSCWWEDAADDFVTCVSGSNPDTANCASGQTCNITNSSPKSTMDDTIGLCGCNDDDDCNNNCTGYVSGDDGTRCGICDTDNNVCGPSFCNGYRICSCFAGCAPAYKDKPNTDTEYYPTPSDMCGDTDNAFEGFCCEGNYPIRTTGQETGYCSDSTDCSNAGPDTDCVISSTADVDTGDCILQRCNSARVWIDEPLAWSPGIYNNAPYSGLPADCCSPDTDTDNPVYESTYADANSCTADSCDISDYTDINVAVASGTLCEAVSPGQTANVADWCQWGTCSTDPDTDIECIPINALNASPPLDNLGNDGSCVAMNACFGVATCVDSDVADTDTTLWCVPVLNIASPDSDYETCETAYNSNSNIPAAGTPIGTTEDTLILNYACADNDYSSNTSTSRFSTCAAPGDDADYVVNYNVESSNGYQLQHLAMQLDSLGSATWRPYFYARERSADTDSTYIDDFCEDTNNQVACASPTCPGTTYSSYYTCANNNPVITTGPWPIRIYPSNISGGEWYEEDDWYGSVILDNWWNAVGQPAGGDVELNAIKEDHNNNSCDNDPSSASAPLIKGFTSWKEIWRGNTVGYTNAADPDGYISGCTSHGTSADNKPAYFRVDFEDGDEDGWGHNYKITIDGGDTNNDYDAVLAWWQAPNDRTCVGVRTMGGGDCGSNPAGLWPGSIGAQERIFPVGASRNGWLELTNDSAGSGGGFDGFETGDLSVMPWDNSATYTFEVTGAATDHTGSFSMISNNTGIDHSESMITVNAYSDGQICFWAKGQSESSYDYFRFKVDGVIKLARAGSYTTWAEYCYAVSVGSHNFTWSYSKDAYTSSGWDEWIVDDITFSATPLAAEGDYQLEVLRAPREFLGMHENFTGGSSACSGAGFGHDTWDILDASDPANNNGVQIDFIPTNDPIKGYAVNVHTPTAGSKTSDGWLVDPSGIPLCSGGACGSEDGTSGHIEMPFQLPFSGNFYTHYRVDPNGRIDFGDASMTHIFDRTAASNKINNARVDGGYNPFIAPMWGSLNPCFCSNVAGGWMEDARWDEGGCFVDPTQYKNDFDEYGSQTCNVDDDCPGDLRCGPSSTTFTDSDSIPDGDHYCQPDYVANLYAQNSTWDNSTVVVVTWDGFDGYVEPSQRDTCVVPGGCGGCDVWECSAKRDEHLQFQAIIRADGRFTFYYKSTTAKINRILDYNAWLTGFSGTRYSSSTCSNDAWCNSDLGDTDNSLTCDNDSYRRSGWFGSITLYEAGDMCVKRIEDPNFFTNLGTEQWQGE